MLISSEVLKGHIDLIIISLIAKEDMYGYKLANLVREQSNNQFELKEGTLYLSLKRLEKQKIIEGYWSNEVGPGGRRKYYTLTADGIEEFNRRKKEWTNLKVLIDLFLKEEEPIEKDK